MEGGELIWILVGIYNTVGKNRNMNGRDDTEERKKEGEMTEGKLGFRLRSSIQFIDTKPFFLFHFADNTYTGTRKEKAGGFDMKWNVKNLYTNAKKKSHLSLFFSHSRTP